MLKRIWLFLLALFITWQVGAEIGAAFPVWPFDGFGAPGNAFTPNFAFFFAFLVDAILIWIALKLVIGFVQLAWPASQRYGATKTIRRTQGWGFEFLLFAGIFTAILLAITVSGADIDRMARVRAKEIAPTVRETILNPLAEKATEWSRAVTAQEAAWQQANAPRQAAEAEYMSVLFQLNNWRPDGRPYRPGLFQLMVPETPPVFTPYDRVATWRQYRQYNIERYFAPRDANIANLAAVADAEYAKLQSQRQSLEQARQALSAATEELRAGADAPIVLRQALADVEAHSFFWQFLRVAEHGVDKLFPVVLAIYLLITFKGKATIAAIYEPLRRFLDAGKFGVGGSARLAALFEEWRERWKLGSGQALFLGRSLYTRSLHLGLKDDRHMLTIAGSRGGKGRTAIIPNLLTWEGSVIVIDPKGTNAAVTASRRKAMGQAVFVVDPFKVLEERTGTEWATAGFNPLAGLDLDAPDIRERLGVIADAIVVPDQEAKDKHWDDGARTIVAGLLAHLVSTQETPSLGQLRELVTLDDEAQRQLWAEMSENRAAGGAAREAANRIIRGYGGSEISGLISNADKHTEWLASAPVANVLAQKDVSFAALKDEPTTVYLVLPPHYLEEHKRFLRLFVNLAIRQMSVGGRAKVPVLMVLDEFLALGHMAEVARAFGLMAGYNFVLWPFVQDLGRLRDLYKNSVNSFINNSRAVQVFAVSDEATTKFVSERIGERSLGLFGLGARSNVVPLRTPTEVAKEVSVDTGYQYVLRAGKAPLLLEKVRYDESEEGDVRAGWQRYFPFHQLYDKDPDFIRR